jgi:polyhydroxyalkanoate synthase
MTGPDLRGLRRWAAEGAQGLRTRAINGLRHLSDVPVEDVASTPRDAVWTRDNVTLYRYRGGGTERRTPIVLVMSLVTRSYVLDLRPGSSLVQDLLAAGYDVFLLDWGVPGAAEAGNDLSTYSDEYIPLATRAAVEISGADKVHLLGYCLGGVLAMLAAAGNPDLPIRGLVLLATPMDFSQMPPLPAMFGAGRLEPAMVIDDTGNVPAAAVKDVFALVQPMVKLTTAASMWASTSNDEATRAHKALIGWSNEHIPFPGAAFADMVHLLLRESRLVSGRVPVGRREVDLRAIPFPVLNVVGDRDALVPPEANAVIEDALDGVALDSIHLPAGHAGLFVGRSARKHCVPSIVAWLAALD